MTSTGEPGSPPRPPVMNPVSGTTIDTSAGALGLHHQPSTRSDTPTSPSSDGEHEEPSKGLLTKAFDKLSRSKTGSKSEKKPSDGSTKPKRVSMTGISRKGRKNSPLDGAGSITPSTDLQAAGPRVAVTSPVEEAPAAASAQVDQPHTLSRSAFGGLGGTFKGDGSHRLSGRAFQMRMGTQPLIQALQSIPWDEDRDDEAVSTALRPPIGSRHDSGLSSGSEDEDPQSRRASSIHAIHRPVARARRTPMPARAKNTAPSGYFSAPSDSDALTEEDDDNGGDVEDEEMDEQHEDMVLKSMHLPKVAGVAAGIPPQQQVLNEASLPLEASTSGATISPNTQITTSRLTLGTQGGDNMTNIRMRRKARLAHKLQDVFNLRQVEEVIAEMPCWLLRSVLLQGYMYVTTKHLCFFAHMPAREDQVLKSGSLSKKASRTKMWNKHWFVLKNDVLSWYSSSADPYFPHGNVDLRYATSCDSVGEKDFKLRTTQKSVHLSADSVPSRDEWVKAIKKVMFKAQNLGDSVKIALPFSAILDVEVSTAMEFSHMIEVKVQDKDDYFASDSYFFTYFQDLDAAVKQIKDALTHYRATMADTDVLSTAGGSIIPPSTTIRDTTRAVAATMAGSEGPLSTSPLAMHFPSPAPAPAAITSRFGGFTSLLSLGSRATVPSPASSNTILSGEAPRRKSEAGEDFTHVNIGTGQSSPPPTKASGRSDTTGAITQRSVDPTTPTPQSPKSFPQVNHRYPPVSSHQELGEYNRISVSDAQGRPVPEATSLLGGVVPHWLKSAPKNTLKMFSSTSAAGAGSDSDPESTPRMSGDIIDAQSATSHSSDGHHAMGFSMMEAPALSSPGGNGGNEKLDSEIVAKYKRHFALDEKEQLLGYFPGYMVRVLPLYGRIYISTNHFCYRSSQPLRKTMMNIPLLDILSAEKCRAFRFGHHGLCIVIKAHEEIFFEFNSTERRTSCMALLQSALDEAQRRLQKGDLDPVSQSKQDALILEELEPTGYMGDSSDGSDLPIPRGESDNLPAVMFTSDSASFLAFKPQEPLHITCLTIGSRGDCQPYIALCKRLQQDGHTCRIATHVEYKDWVEGHGIQFTAVGGDPAELMRICVENGMFTYGFLKEGLSKFRGWLDDLLATSWEACQGTDLLIESPSAMAGIHIAEGLRIPYFRAFTMPYSRTRAYPHAFAVPERKMGGSYNYMTYVAFDQVFWRAISGQVNRWRRNVMGIAGTTFDRLEQHKVPFLYNFSPTVVPPPLDWYEWIRITGYWFLDDPDDNKTKKWTPPADLVSFIDSAHALGKKVVYIGFGSIVVSDPEAMTRAVVEAIELSGVYAILSKGWSDRLSAKKADGHPEVPEIKLPPQIYSISSIPHDWLFPRIDAACHHGGAGTTGASLRAGLPTIIKPFFGDQFFWADRVEALDVGSSVRKLTVDHLTTALKAATTDLKQIEKAKLLGQKIRAEKGVDNAVEAIYRDLEYARSLIKQPSVPEESHGEVDVEITTPKTTPDNSIESSGNGSAKSDWDMLSGSEGGLDRSRVPHPSRHGLNAEASSPTPMSVKRSSITGAFNALSSAIPGLKRANSSEDHSRS
ncbi:Sterol 3-beta-glucosyltransferase [Tulasnella sp. 332]|nr:Sterol 3-beta-glucosyltransferase [Tulasnella sp. 332]